MNLTTTATAVSTVPPGDPAEFAAAVLELLANRLPTGHLPGALSPEQAAGYLGLGRSTLDAYAIAGLVPPPSKVGAKVLYCRAELDSWLGHGCPVAAEWLPLWKRLRVAAPHSNN